MATYELRAPLTDADVEQLQIGDLVYLSGPCFTCRSKLQRYIFDEGHTLPFQPEPGSVLIHNGPIVVKEDGKWKLMSFMPTSSLRFEKWGADSVEKWGLRIIVGKTTMGKDTLDAMEKYGCVHVSPQCVSPNLWHDSITIQGVELFEELGSIEACWLLDLNELGPFIVDMDSHGRNYFDELDVHVAKQRDAVLEAMGVPADFTPTKLY